MSAQIHISEALLLPSLLLLSGFFSGSEAVLMSIGIDRAKQLLGGGGGRGRAMAFMVDRPNELLATILVGNNIVNIGVASLTTAIATRFFMDDAVGISVGVVTIAILVFGEVLPKSFARARAEALSVPVIRVLRVCYYLLYPVVKVLVFIIRRVLGDNAELAGRLVTKNELEYMVGRAEQEKTIDSKQLDLINSALEFPTIKIKDIMVPRSRVRYIKAGSSFGEVSDRIRRDSHSRYPVCEDELESTKGILHVKSLAFLSEEEKGSFDIARHLKEPFFVYEYMKIQSVFDHMNRKKSHLALVKDETGLVVGIVTLEDIVEEILGDIHDEHDPVAAKARGRGGGDLARGLRVDGHISLRDLDGEFGVKIPLNDNYSTLAGFILSRLGNKFPEEGQSVSWEGLSFSLSRVKESEIQEILIRRTGEDGRRAPQEGGGREAGLPGGSA